MFGEIFKLFGTIGLNTDDAERGVDSVTGKAKKAGSKIGGYFKKAATVVAGAFAAGKLIQFGGTAIKAAAEAKAIGAQFEQVFGDIQTEAQGVIDRMSETFGMLPNRLKPAYTQSVSMFKGLGLDTEDAMTQAERSVTAAADAAAFYDKSYEDANGALGSFIKGNYEGGEAIGLFANETQLAAYAAKNGIEDFSGLEEAQKQIIRLDYAEAMLEAGGATGQAARESDAYENQMGNLKQAWQDFKALVGAPILDTAVAGLTKAAEWTQLAGEKVKQFQGWFGELKAEVADSTAWNSLKDVIQIGLDKFNEFKAGLDESGAFDRIKETLTQLKDAILEIDFREVLTQVQEFLDKWGPLIAGIVAGIATFKLLVGVMALVKTAMVGLAAIKHAIVGFKTAVAVFGGVKAAAAALIPVITGVSLPILGIVAAVAAAVTAGVLLWKNWDTVKAKALELQAKVVETINRMKAGIYNALTSVQQTFSSIWSSIFSGLSGILESIFGTSNRYFNSMKTNIFTIMNSLYTLIAGTLEYIKNTFMNALNFLKGIVTGDFQMIKHAATSQLNIMKEQLIRIWNTLKTITTNTVSALVNLVKGRFLALKNGVINTITALKNGAIAIWNGLKATGSAIWNGLKTALLNTATGIKNGITNTITGLKNAALNIFNSIKNGINNTWNAVKSLTSAAWNFITNYILTKIRNAANGVRITFNAIRSVISSVFSTIRNLASAAWTFIASRFTNGISRIRSITSAGFNFIRSTISSIINRIKSLISTGLNNIKNNFSRILNGLRSIVTGAFGKVRSAISSGMSNALSTITRFFSRFKSAGANIVGNIADGIKSSINKVKDGVGNVLQKARNLLPFSPPKDKSSPMAGIEKNGIMEQIAAGVYKSKDKLDRAMRDVMPDDADLEATAKIEAVTSGNGRTAAGSSYATKQTSTTRDQEPTWLQTFMTEFRSAVRDITDQPVIVQVDGRTIAVATRDPLDEELGYKERDRNFNTGRRPR